MRRSLSVGVERATFRPFFDVKQFGARGDGIRNDTRAVEDAIAAAADAGGGIVYLSPTSGGYLLPGESRIDLKSGVTLLGSGWGGRIVRSGDFAKADSTPIFFGAEWLTDTRFEHVYADGGKDEIALAQGTLDGSYTFPLGGFGDLTVSSVGVPFGAPDDFGVVLIGSVLVRYTSVLGTTGTVTLRGCTAPDGTMLSNGAPVLESSGNLRMPFVNLANGGTRIGMHFCTIVNWPGQPFQANGPNDDPEVKPLEDFEICHNLTEANRGIVLRRNVRRGRIIANQVTSTDDAIAILGLDADEGPRDLEIGLNEIHSQAFEDADAEFSGYGLRLAGVQNSVATANKIRGSTPSPPEALDRAGLLITDSETCTTKNLLVLDTHVHDSHGYGIRIGTVQDDPFSGESITVRGGGVFGCDAEGVELDLGNSGSTPRDISIESLDLVDTGQRDGGTLDAIRVFCEEGSSITGLHITGNRIIRAGRRAIYFASDETATDVRLDSNYIEDPNFGENADIEAIRLAGCANASVRMNQITGGAAALTHGFVLLNSCSAIARTDNIIDPGVITDSLVVDNSTDPVYAGPPLSFYRLLHENAGRLTDAASSGTTYLLQPNAIDVATPLSPAAVGYASARPFAIEAADYDVRGLETRLRIAGQLSVGSTAPGVTVTLGLYEITIASNSATWNLVSGSTVAFASPAANAATSDYSADFDAPASGVYALGYTVSGTPAGTVAITGRVEVVSKQ